MKTEKFFTKYNWYGYEGVGHSKCEYTSKNINDVIKFIEFCEKLKSQKFDWDNEDDVNQYDDMFAYRSNGFLDSFDGKIYKRTTIEEPADLKQELRNSKIEDIIN